LQRGSTSSVIECIDAESIYDVPLLMHEEKLDVEILKKLKVKCTTEPDLADWEKFLFKLKNPKREVSIGLVGKYVELKDAYKSINESFIHAGAVNEAKVNVRSIHSETINEKNVAEKLAGLDGVLVAPGFGPRGIEGKIIAIGYAREKNIPFLGICLGMQCAVIEFGRNVLGLKEANSTEFDKTTPDPVIDMMEMQKKIAGLGGTMRLGAFPCRLKKGSKAYDVYKVENIFERHRHRYELNNAYVEQYQKAGLIPVGINEKDNLVEIVELKGHPWFIGVQFHPEFKSTVANPHPLFVAFVKAAIDYNSKQKKHKKSS
jgi:CTP synthase